MPKKLELFFEIRPNMHVRFSYYLKNLEKNLSSRFKFSCEIYKVNSLEIFALHYKTRNSIAIMPFLGFEDEKCPQQHWSRQKHLPTIVIEASFKEVFGNALKKYKGTFFSKVIPELKLKFCSVYINAIVQLKPDSSKSVGFLKPSEKCFKKCLCHKIISLFSTFCKESKISADIRADFLISKEFFLVSKELFSGIYRISDLNGKPPRQYREERLLQGNTWKVSLKNNKNYSIQEVGNDLNVCVLNIHL